MADHYPGCWRDPAHHACAVKRVALEQAWAGAYKDRAEAAEAALATARAEALEEAADWHEHCAAEWDAREDGRRLSNWHADSAAAIRALKDRRL